MEHTSAYLARLVLLREQIHWENSSLPQMSERLRMISILTHIQDTILFFEKEITKAGESIPLHIDEGVNYLEWCNPEWIMGNAWMSSKKEIVEEHQHRAWNANSESLLNDITINELSGYLPNSIRPEYADDIGRSRFGEALQLISGPFFNIANLQLAIYAAAKNLATTLKNLQTAINEERSPQEYIGMMTGLWMAYNTTNNGDAYTIRAQYENDKLESSEDITLEWLKNRRDEAIQEFKDTSFFAIKMRDTSNDACRAAKRIYTIKDDFLHFDQDAEVGKFIHKRHMSKEQINEFFDFRKKVELIQEDMLRQREQLQDIFPKDKDFSGSVFKNNRDRRRIYNKLYQLVNTQHLISTKRQWYIIYLVFKEKNWLDKLTATAFAKDISSVYQGIMNEKLWTPTGTDFKEVDNYYKKHAFSKWDESDSSAPVTCGDYIRIAQTIDATFDRTYLL